MVYRYNPDHATFVTPLNRKEKHSTHVHLGRGSPYGSSITQSLFTMSATSYDDEYDESNGGIPMDGELFYAGLTTQPLANHLQAILSTMKTPHLVQHSLMNRNLSVHLSCELIH